MSVVTKPLVPVYNNSRAVSGPYTLVASLELISFEYVPGLNEAVCMVRDHATRTVRGALASSLLAVSYGKDAYLLELTSRTGGQ